MRKTPFVGILLIMSCTNNPLGLLTPVPVNSDPIRYATIQAGFCTTVPTTKPQIIKYLFIIDKSAYNFSTTPVEPPDQNQVDPNGAKRYGPIVQFIEGVQSLPPSPVVQTYYSLIDFDTIAGLPLGLIKSGFMSDVSDFMKVLNQDWQGSGTRSSPSPIPAGTGFTSYLGALTSAYNVITGDIKSYSRSFSTNVHSPAKISYQIVFISGGMPIIPDNKGGAQSESSPLGAVGLITGIPVDPNYQPYVSSVVFNTAYYFNSEQIIEVQTLLQQMSVVGNNGGYFQFGAGQGDTYQQLNPPTIQLKSKLMDVFVENENLVWWDDGKLMVDSDSDGLPDLIETQLGSNPFLKDSDGNGVSDLVEYRLTGQPCTGATCAQASRNAYSVCSGFAPVVDSSNVITYLDTDRDGLNDCEEFLLNSDLNNFSTPNNFIPDFFAFKNLLSLAPLSGSSSSSPLNLAQANPLGDGVSNYSKMKLGLPTFVQAQVSNYRTRETDLQPALGDVPGSLDGQDCYQMTVKSVAVSGASNRIKIYVVENKSVIDNQPTLQVAEKNLAGTSLNLSFDNTDFK